MALRVLDHGGGPGARGARHRRVTAGSTVVAVVEAAGTTFTYTPPAVAAREQLVVLAHARDGADARIGMELARFDLTVTP